MTGDNELMQALEPCPFCDGDELSHGYEMAGSYFAGIVQCHTCNVYVTADSEAEAIAAWNRRASSLAGDAEPVAVRIGRAEVKGGSVGFFAFEQTDLPDGEYPLYATPVSGDAGLRKALEKIATRLSAHPDDTPEDDRRGRHYAYSIATNALATLATPPSVPAQQGWLPIETAPKTGEPVLIWKPDERMVGEYMMVAYWDDDYPAGEPGWVPVGGAHKQGYASSVTGTDQGYPTHWMPLPATPPSQDQKGEEGND